VTESPLLEDLRRAAAPAPAPAWKPGVIYSGRLPSEIITPDLPAMESEEEWEKAVMAMGVPLPEGHTLMLVEAQYAYSHNENAWKRDPDDRGKKDTAYTGPNDVHRWRYKFRVVPKSTYLDEDIAVLMKEAKRAKRAKPVPTLGGSMPISLADFQTGKVDILGGTPELLERNEKALAEKIAEVKRVKPKQIVLVDPGDSTEGFESAPNANRTNDLSMTEQIRVWRRILWRWIEEMSKLTDDLVVIGVPSNHCRVRQGKNALGDALDDWGIDVIAQVSDIAAANPDAYGHVSFHIPEEHMEYVLFTLADGKVLGVVHGHQVGSVEKLAEYVKKNSKGGIGRADIIICGHFHHLRVIAFGFNQWLIVSPTMDGGSSWFDASGERSEPGVLSVVIDANGWRDLHIAWTG
jgi:hypothetical protein